LADTTEYRQSLIGGMSSARKPLIIWWYSWRQKPLAVLATFIMPSISYGWFL